MLLQIKCFKSLTVINSTLKQFILLISVPCIYNLVEHVHAAFQCFSKAIIMDTQIFYTYIFRITEINYVINVYYFLNLLYRIFRTFLLSLLNSFNESGLIIYQKYSIIVFVL